MRNEARGRRIKKKRIRQRFMKRDGEVEATVNIPCGNHEGRVKKEFRLKIV